MFWYTIWILVHPTYLALSSETLSNEIKNLVFFTLNNSKTNFFPHPQEQKSGRRQTKCSCTLCECLCTLLFGVVLCNPLEWGILWFISGQKSCFLCFEQQQNKFYSSTTITGKWEETNTMFLYTVWMFVHPSIWCCPLQPSWMRYFVIHFWSKIMFFVLWTTAKQILFLNHNIRKVGGDKHNVLVHYFNALKPFQMRYFVVHFDWKSCFLCFEQQQNKFYSSTTETEKW